MSRIIKTWRDPYDAGFSTCRKKQIEIQQGLTVLVGCNGSGKTTLLHNIKSELKKEDIPVFYYDNEKDGGNNSISESIFYGNLSFTATALCSSEGENISLNLSKIASKLRKFVETGDNGDRFNALAKTLALKDDNEENNVSNERWILLDAMDSGYSIDNVIEMKDFFDLVIKDAKEFGIELYIMISSNEYELAHESKCFDVMEGKYIQFASYEDYKKFILRTREKKDKRKYR
jgi:predicted ATP-dependent endonuclease of OLD family